MNTARARLTFSDLFGEQFGKTAQIFKMHWFDDQALSPPGINRCTFMQNDVCRRIYIVALFVIAEGWELSKCLLREGNKEGLSGLIWKMSQGVK